MVNREDYTGTNTVTFSVDSSTTITLTNYYSPHYDECMIKELIKEAKLKQMRSSWYNPVIIGKPSLKTSYVKPYIRNKLKSTTIARIKQSVING